MKNLGAFHALAMLGIIASAALVAGLVIVTRQMDRQQYDRETVLVSSQVDSSLAAARGSISASSKSDDAILHLDHSQDGDWARRTFVSREDANIWLYTADYQDNILSGLHAGQGARYPFEAELPERMAAFRSSSPSTVSLGMFWSANRLYMLVVAPFSVFSGQVQIVHSRPPVLAAVTPLDSFLKPHFAGTGVQGIALTADLLGHPRGKALADSHGRTVAMLTWQPSRPGAELRRVILPPLLILVVLFVGLVSLAYRRGVLAARQLVASEARAHTLAFNDPLSELANRRLFLDQLGQAVSRCNRTRADLAVLLIDLDRFKLVNDTHGHQCGDELIREVGRRLKAASRSGDLCARLGGDEFVILAHDCDAAAAGMLARRILDALAEPMQLSQAEIRTAGSIGISLFRDRSESETLMREADLALYQVKEKGRGSFCFFEIEMNLAVQYRRSLEADLRTALAQGDLDVVYQPQFHREELVAVEALVRWTHPVRGAVPPSHFVPLAEECGLIAQLGSFVMRRAFEDSRHWPALCVAINLSAVELRMPGFAAAIGALVRELGVDPTRFELELTEGVLLADDLQTQHALASLKASGFTLTLDDFGTGYSSLSYLRRFSIDKIKIDRSFVSGLPLDSVSAAVIKAIVHLGRALDMQVLAEGVETREQQSLLSSIGCHLTQGYLLGRPAQAEDIVALIRTRTATANQVLGI